MFWSLLNAGGAINSSGSMKRSLQPTQVAQVVQLIQDGTSMRAVARRFAVSVSVASRAWRRTKRQASTSGDVEEAVGGQQPSSRTATSTFVQGGAGGALPEPCKITYSRPQMCMCPFKWSETDSMSVV
ncbi:hypothetical protein UPYG_G00294050 [Umbra pygmaea]|uniref:Resolvase HTH domain-containing protein n=1 Tax=Umbra pygmaea TaxID=75934 RepID=A0ABD0WRP0_UMBPY